MAIKTLHNKKALLKALETSMGVVSTACKKAGLSRVTYYDYYNNDPEFNKAVDELSNVALDFAESKLFGQIQSDNTTAIIFYLKCKGKGRGYIERQELDLGVGTKVTINFGDGDKDIG